MPNIDVFLRDDNHDLASYTTDDISAALDDSSLYVESLKPSEQGIFYIFMLDVSSSVQLVYLNAAKQAVLDTYDSLRPQDRLAVIAFGEEVWLLLDGTEARDEVYGTLKALGDRDSYTQFYGAMKVLVDTAAAVEDMRRIAVVVSDGVSTSDADMSQEALEQLLQERGIAVYALAVDSTSEEDIAAFRSFIQLSGGELHLFSPDDVSQSLEKLLEQIGSIWHLKLEADSNIADAASHTLSVGLAAGEEASVSLLTQKWIPDSISPRLLKCVTDTQTRKIHLFFSEPMLGLDCPENYLLTNSEGATVSLAVCAVRPDSISLKADELEAQPGWTLELTGITDNSMEKNTLEEKEVVLFGTASANLTTAAEQSLVAQESDAVRAKILHSVLVTAAVILLILGLGAVLLLIRRKKGTVEKKPGNRLPLSIPSGLSLISNRNIPMMMHRPLVRLTPDFEMRCL